MTRFQRRILRRTWHAMQARCYSPNHVGYYNYGGRGITVCEEWRNSFEQFMADMGERPSRVYSLDRIDNSGNYSPSNCRWATWAQQVANRRPRGPSRQKAKISVKIAKEFEAEKCL